MNKKNKETIILKLGGSIVTYKSDGQVRIRRKRLEGIATEVKSALRTNSNVQLMLVHGAGGAGHKIAKDLNLTAGVSGDKSKLKGSLQIRLNNQYLNAAIVEAFMKVGLPVVSIQSGSVIIQKQGSIETLATDLLQQALNNGCIPLMNGEMVFDTALGMSVCSGDAICGILAREFNATKVLYATDVDGVYDKDPFVYKNAKLFSKVTKSEAIDESKISLNESDRRISE
jgi:isopentenyl phosphate kinase